MQPKTSQKTTVKEFQATMKTFHGISEAKKHLPHDPAFHLPFPESIAIKLTHRCNLRCKHCYEWNEDGYLTRSDACYQTRELDFELFESVLAESRKARSRLYLWGGEPLLYSRFDDVIGLLMEDPREISICTNGILLGRYMERLSALPGETELLVAIEGFQRAHDAIRGTGSYERAMAGLKSAVQKKQRGEFCGKISVHTMVSSDNVSELYDLLLFYEQMGIDLVMLCFPWYISDACSEEMDVYVTSHFDWMEQAGGDKNNSWHSFKYRFDRKGMDALRGELEKIYRHTWSNRVRLQPELAADELEDFLMGKNLKIHGISHCIGLCSRADIDAAGDVTACKHFKEFTIGNLHESSLEKLWNSDRYDAVRAAVNTELMPACSKCNVLYLHHN